MRCTKACLLVVWNIALQLPPCQAFFLCARSRLSLEKRGAVTVAGRQACSVHESVMEQKCGGMAKQSPPQPINGDMLGIICAEMFPAVYKVAGCKKVPVCTRK